VRKRGRIGKRVLGVEGGHEKDQATKLNFRNSVRITDLTFEEREKRTQVKRELHRKC